MSEPIRVAHVMGKMSGGGVESVVMNYYRNIDRKLVQFDLLVDSDSTLVPQDEIEFLGGRVFEIPPYQHAIAYQYELTRLFRGQGWPIVHSHINTLSIFPLRAAKNAGVPIRIAHSHATAGKGETMRNMMKYALRPFANIYPTHRLACSEYAGRWLFGDSPFDILVNAFDVGDFRFNSLSRRLFRNAYGIDSRAIVFGHAGRFAPPKNQSRLIRVFSRVVAQRPESVLMLAGQGPDFQFCRGLAGELGVEDKVFFLGQYHDMASFYSGIDVFLLPSTYEGFGLALVEAQASGLPCLASSSISQDANPLHSVGFIEFDDEAAWYSAMLDMEPRENRVLTTEDEQGLARFEIKGASSWLASYYERASRSLPATDAIATRGRRLRR